MGTVRYTVIDGEVVSELRDGVKRDYLPDPLGSTIALLDNTQTKTDTFEYWPYGEFAARTGTTPTPFQFVGTMGYYNDSSSKSYIRARHLDKSTGRWLSIDVLDNMLLGIENFTYAKNNPVFFSDKTGFGVGDPFFNYTYFCGASVSQACDVSDCKNYGKDCIDQACCIHDKCVGEMSAGEMFNPFINKQWKFRGCNTLLCARAYKCAVDRDCLSSPNPFKCAAVTLQIITAFCPGTIKNPYNPWGNIVIPF